MELTDSVFNERRDSVLLPSGERHRIRYLVVPLDAVLASHQPLVPPFRLQATANYPAELQHRMYCGPRATRTCAALARMLEKFEADRLTDRGLGSELGPPVVVRRCASTRPIEWLCVVGNLRVILLKLARIAASSSWKRRAGEDALRAYNACLQETITALGLSDMAADGHGVLVRELTDLSLNGDEEADRSAHSILAGINRGSDMAFTRSKDIASIGYTYARGLRDAVRRVGSDGKSSARAATVMRNLREGVFAPRAFNARLPRWASQLTTDLWTLGVIPEAELNLLLLPAHDGVTEIGARYARHIVSSLAFDDPEFIDRVPRFMVPRFLAVAPQLIRVVDQGDWDIRNAVAAGGRFLLRSHMEGIGHRLRMYQRLRRCSPREAQTWLSEALPTFITPAAPRKEELFFSVASESEWAADERDPLECEARRWAAILLFGAGRDTRSFRAAMVRWVDSAPTHLGGQGRLFSADCSDDAVPPSVNEIFGGNLPELRPWLDAIPAAGSLREPGQRPSTVHKEAHEVRAVLAHAWRVGVEALFSAAVAAWPILVEEQFSEMHPKGRRGYASRCSLAEWFGFAVVRHACWLAQRSDTLPGRPSDRQLRRAVVRLRHLDNGGIWPVLCAAAPVLSHPLQPGRRAVPAFKL